METDCWGAELDWVGHRGNGNEQCSRMAPPGKSEQQQQQQQWAFSSGQHLLKWSCLWLRECQMKWKCHSGPSGECWNSLCAAPLEGVCFPPDTDIVNREEMLRYLHYLPAFIVLGLGFILGNPHVRGSARQKVCFAFPETNQKPLLKQSPKWILLWKPLLTLILCINSQCTQL